jgi:hypothetical protein
MLEAEKVEYIIFLTSALFLLFDIRKNERKNDDIEYTFSICMSAECHQRTRTFLI